MGHMRWSHGVEVLQAGVTQCVMLLFYLHLVLPNPTFSCCVGQVVSLIQIETEVTDLQGVLLHCFANPGAVQVSGFYI